MRGAVRPSAQQLRLRSAREQHGSDAAEQAVMVDRAWWAASPVIPQQSQTMRQKVLLAAV